MVAAGLCRRICSSWCGRLADVVPAMHRKRAESVGQIWSPDGTTVMTEAHSITVVDIEVSRKRSEKRRSLGRLYQNYADSEWRTFYSSASGIYVAIKQASAIIASKTGYSF